MNLGKLIAIILLWIFMTALAWVITYKLGIGFLYTQIFGHTIMDARKEGGSFWGALFLILHFGLCGMIGHWVTERSFREDLKGKK